MNILNGSKEKAIEFFSRLDKEDRTALISHTDLDGIASAKIVNKIFNADIIKFVNYSDLNENLVAELELEGVNKIIMTDLMIEAEKNDFVKGLENFADLLIIDHHPPNTDLNSDKTIFIICEEGYCASYLCYKILNDVGNLEDLDWIAACASISDFCNVKNREWIENVFLKYGERLDNEIKLGFDMEEINKYKIYELQWKLSLAIIYFKDNLHMVFDSIKSKFGDIGDLEKYYLKVKDEIDKAILEFDSNKKDFPGGHYFEFNPKFGIASITSNLISTKYSSKTIVIARPKGDNYVVSARRHDSGDNMNDLLRFCMRGFSDFACGGHLSAAGGYYPKKYLDEFKRRLGVK